MSQQASRRDSGPLLAPLERYCAEEVRKGAEPYLASQLPAVVIQLWTVLLVVASKQHDAHQVGERILHDLPVPRGCLRVASKDVGCDAHTLSHVLRCEEFTALLAFVQEKGKVSLLAVRTHTGQYLASPTGADGYHPIGVIFDDFLIQLKSGYIGEVAPGI